jgi:hypothetical protein
MPVWVGSESKWEKAKKLAKKQYPDATGDKFWSLVAGIYKQMGGPIKKSRTPGSQHPNHHYLSRTGSPKKYSYTYEDPDEDGDNDSDLGGPDVDAEEDAPKKKVGLQQQSEETPPKAPKKAGVRSQFMQNQKQPGIQLQKPPSVLRDARPDDLEEDSMVLWMPTDERTFESMKQQGKFIGSDADQGNTFSGTRAGALGLATEEDRPGAPMLLAIRVPVASLEPIPDAETVEESLFPDNPAMSQIHVAGAVPGNAIVGIVQEGDPLWPQDIAQEQAKVDDQQPDTENEVPQ